MIETKDGYVKAIGSDDEILADIGAIIDAIAEHWDVSIGDLLWTIGAMMFECVPDGEEEEEGEAEDERKLSKECSREEMADPMQRRIRSGRGTYRRR